MKKKLYITAVVSLLIIAGILIYINQPRVDFENVTLENEEETVQEEQEDHQMEPIEEEEQPEEHEEEDTQGTLQGPLQGPLSEAVHATVDFFSGRKLNILAIGDSLTQGVGDSREQGGYVGLLERSINAEEELVTFENLGVRGNRSAQLLARLEDPEVEEEISHADKILVTIGANDVMSVLRNNITNLQMQDFIHENELYEERLYEIFTRMEEINPRADIFLLGFFNPFDKYFQDIPELNMIVNEWNETGKTVSDQFDAMTFIPIEDLFDDHEEELFAEDNFHPNDEGYRRIAQRVLDYLTGEEG